VTPFGDRAVRFTIPASAPRRRMFAELSALPGVVDVILGEEVGCVVFADVASDRSAVRTALSSSGEDAPDEPSGRAHRIDVVYDGEDLEHVAATIGRSKADVIALHADAEYRVAMLGFMPGFAYLTGLPSQLRLPRRAPRPRVPAGSVAIAADYTGIYPFASPGGWHLLGHAPSFAPFDLQRDGHAVLAIGDVVRFVASPAEERGPRAPLPDLPPPRGAHLEITRASGFAILVDGGRPGRMHEGIPPGGPLVRAKLAHANALVGNAPTACAIELTGTFEVTARGGDVRLADDLATSPILLADGERHVVSTEGRTRVRYLALAGGIAAPRILGGRGALLGVGIGKLLGKGTRLEGDAAPVFEAVDMSPGPTQDGPIEVVPGPDVDALPLLASCDLRIAPASDRTGTRLEGLPDLPGATAMGRRSTPMVVGAIELTPSGLVVLGPDHPTTGGYPVVAVVRDAALDAFFARPIGSTIRFRMV
jgi:KipI family sensor histidine kinase inhibitor